MVSVITVTYEIKVADIGYIKTNTAFDELLPEDRSGFSAVDCIGEINYEEVFHKNSFDHYYTVVYEQCFCI